MRAIVVVLLTAAIGVLSGSQPTAPPFLTLPAVHCDAVMEIYSDTLPALGFDLVGWSDMAGLSNRPEPFIRLT